MHFPSPSGRRWPIGPDEGTAKRRWFEPLRLRRTLTPTPLPRGEGLKLRPPAEGKLPMPRAIYLPAFAMDVLTIGVWVRMYTMRIAIGRASGRERGCQDREIPGVAGQLKKKT